MRRSVIGGIVVFARFKYILIIFATTLAGQLRHHTTSLLEAKARLAKSFNGNGRRNSDWRTVVGGGCCPRRAFDDDRYFSERWLRAKMAFEFDQRPANRLLV